MVFGSASLEQLGNPWQTAGDIARRRTFGWDTRQRIAGMDLSARFNRQNGSDSQNIAGFIAV